MPFFKISMPKCNAGTEEEPDIAYIIVEAPDREHAAFYAGAAFICGRDDERFADEFTELTSTIAVEDSTENELVAREATGAAVVYTCEGCGLPELKVAPTDELWDVIAALLMSDVPASDEMPADSEDPNPADL